jgi:hypothetical protein
VEERYDRRDMLSVELGRPESRERITNSREQRAESREETKDSRQKTADSS